MSARRQSSIQLDGFDPLFHEMVTDGNGHRQCWTYDMSGWQNIRADIREAARREGSVAIAWVKDASGKRYAEFERIARERGQLKMSDEAWDNYCEVRLTATKVRL